MKKMITLSTILLSMAVFSQVGIHTSNPIGTFHVDGAKDNASAGAPSRDQQLNDFVVLGNGNVGIGTTTPSSKIEIIADNQGEGVINDFNFRGFGTSKLPALIFSGANGSYEAQENLVKDDPIGAVTFIPRANNAYNYNGGSRIMSYYQGDGTSGLSDLRLHTSGAERLRILETGDVGIGTNTPTTKLDVNGSGRIRTLNIAPGATVVTPVYSDTDGVLNKAVSGVYGTVINNTVTVASGATSTLINNIPNNSAYKAVVSVGNSCGRFAMADYYITNIVLNNSYAIKGVDGLVNIDTTAKGPAFNEVNRNTTSVTWSSLPPCAGGGAGTAFNYTLTMPSAGTLNLINNGDTSLEYKVILTRLF
ncbi:hypothetical protein [Chryseobacterium sp. JUb7]|uniref:hypothetical protein n=1 Tax=Chryseobacterium sp. JUb7 TaxID=2940599 RepID=UPI002168AA54|nr:hypothetical protein [Chryseobacterium sp. JUb7]MCS3530798.1 hypothetical protein [Chryseobacterium sp. JUb7]